jgi:DNA-binding transcriptional LysR family regulator
MKPRHLEYFVAAAEELNFSRAADRLHVSQPPFSKQIHDLEGELGINLFDRQRKGVELTSAGKSFLIDARKILEECETSIRKAQRISRGEIGELAIGYMAALTHEFLAKALQVWRRIAPEIVIDCIEMDCISQERALLDGRIAVGLLVPSDRPLLELLQVRFLIKYRVKLALPKSHPHADKREIPWSLLKDEPFIGLTRVYPNYREWLQKVCRREGFIPNIVKEADGAPSALAFVAAGYGLAVLSEPMQKIPTEDVVFRDLSPKGREWMPVAAVWRPDSISAPAASKFIDVLTEVCGKEKNGERPALEQFELNGSTINARQRTSILTTVI